MSRSSWRIAPTKLQEVVFLETTHDSLWIYFAAHLHVFGTERNRGSSPGEQIGASMALWRGRCCDAGIGAHAKGWRWRRSCAGCVDEDGSGCTTKGGRMWKLSGLCLEVGWSPCSLLNVNYSSLQIRGPALRRYSELKHLRISWIFDRKIWSNMSNTWCFEVGVWPQTVMMHQWLFNLEFPEMVFVITRHEFLRKRWVKMQQFRKKIDRKKVLFTRSFLLLYQLGNLISRNFWTTRKAQNFRLLHKEWSQIWIHPIIQPADVT